MSIIASFAVPHPPLIVPEVGRGGERQVQKTIESYEKVALEISKLKPDTIIISSPHTIFGRDSFFIADDSIMEGSFASFGARDITFREFVDKELVVEISKISMEEKLPIGKMNGVELDHGTMVPLNFIRKKLVNYKIILVGLSCLSLREHYHLGEIIDRAVNNLGRKAVFVASGDLSHVLQEYGPYGFAKAGPIYEEKIVKTMTNANFSELLDYDSQLLDEAKECGHPSFAIMAGVWANKKVIPTFFSHEDVTGVGYGIWSYYPEKDEYVALAYKAINTYIKEHRKVELPKNLSIALLKEKSGVFVSIHKFGRLRGCIGTFLPVQDCIGKEIIENAIAAATKDPRFIAIKEDELNDLEINVDVLTTPERIMSKTELNPKKYGVIVSKGFKRGLLLPDLEGIDTIDEQIRIAKEKAGIGQEEEVLLERFEVVRHKN